jgi:hypothetical protein
MNTFLAAAAVLSLLGAVLHSVLGERLIFRSLSLDGLPAVAGSALFTRPRGWASRCCSGSWDNTRRWIPSVGGRRR